MIKLTYKPQIDGLRAISVIAVILYHVELFYNDFKIFSGGFIGVDIFFVISGYLITSLIIKEINETNSFSLINFYKRRSKRILPALFVMILISIIFAWNYLTPNSFIQYSKSIISSAFFFSNYFFYLEGLVYNAEGSLLKPLLHTWSLSVEEQFYIFFPLLLICVTKFFNKNFFTLFLILFISSLSISILTTSQNSVFSFFSTLSRVWEFIAGSLLAYLEIKKNKIEMINKNYCSYLGFFLIFFSLFYFDNDSIHPSFLTLVPIIGAFLIIASSNSNNLINKILSNFIFVKIGLISYSLYLWHFPILAFARNRGKVISDFDKLELIGLTVILSLLFYFLVEKPFRKKNFIFKFFSIIILSFVSFFAFFTYQSIKTKGFENRLHVFLKKTQRVLLEHAIEDKNGMCFDRIKDFCNFNENSKRNVILVGDSHMGVLSDNLHKRTKFKKLNYISMNRGGCIYLPNFKKINKKDKQETFNCTLESKKVIDELISNKPNSIIVLGGDFKNHFNDSDKDWKYENDFNLDPLAGYIKSIKKLLNNDYKVILIYPIPGPNFHVIKRLMQEIPKTTFNASKYLSENPLTFNLNKHYEENINIIKSFDKLNHRNLIKILPEKIFCDPVKNACFTHSDKNVYFSDQHHLAEVGASMLVDEIEKGIEKFIKY